MARFLISILLILFVFPFEAVNAQDNQPMRVEFSSLGRQGDYHLLLAKDEGFVVLRNDGKSSDNEIIWKLFCYSADMEKKWNSTISLNEDYSFTRKYYRNGLGYLLFSDRNNKETKFKLYRIDIASGKVISSEFAVEDKINSVDYISVDGHSYILGEKDKGIGKVISNVFSSSRNTQNLKFFHYNWDEDQFYDLTDSINVNMQPRQLYVFEYDKNVDLYSLNAASKSTDEIWRYSFSFDGKFENKHQYSRIKGKTVVDLAVSSLNKRRFLAANMSSFRDRYNHYEDYSDGLYVSIYSEGQEKYSRYYKLSSLNSFYSHADQGMFRFFPAKDEIQGSVGYQIKLHKKARTSKTENIILAEAYYPEYRNEWYYDAYGVAHTRKVFQGYRFTHAMAVGINNDIEISWDVALEISGTHSYSRNKRTDLITDGQTSGIVYNLDNELHYQLVKKGKKLDGKRTVTLPLMNKNDNLKSSKKGRIRHWYEDYMLASGYQKINNSQKGNRQVFYVYKIAFR